MLNTTLIRQHVQIAGLPLTRLSTAKKFDNWQDSGYDKAIIWLHKNTNNDLSLVDFKQQYLMLDTASK